MWISTRVHSGGVPVARYGLLTEQRLEATIKAENTRKSCKSEVSKVPQKDDIFYAANTRHTNQERLQLEVQRAKEREAP